MNRKIIFQYIILISFSVFITIVYLKVVSNADGIFALLEIDQLLKFMFDSYLYFLCFLLLLLVYLIIYGLTNIIISYQSIKSFANHIVYLHVVTLILPWGGGAVGFLPSGPQITVLLSSFLLISYFIIQFAPRKLNIKETKTVSFLILWTILGTFLNYILGISGVDTIRESIPLKIQFTSSILFLDSFLIFYFIVLNKWGEEEFEKILKYVLFIGIIINVECIINFYILNNSSAISYLGHFDSMFIKRRYYPGILGISNTFISFYFMKKYKKNRKIYFLIILLSFFMIYSTFARNILIGWLISIIFYFYYEIKFEKNISNQSKSIKYTIFILIFIISPIIFSVFKQSVLETREDYFSDQTLVGRLYRYSRATDVLIQKPILGTGLGLLPFYSFSREIEPMVSNLALQQNPQLMSYFERNLTYSGPFKSEYESIFETTHNTTLDFIVGLGIVGLIYVLIFINYMIRLHKKIKTILYYGKYDEINHYIILFYLTLAILLALQTTSKFQSYWYIALLFACIRYIFNETKKIKLN